MCCSIVTFSLDNGHKSYFLAQNSRFLARGWRIAIEKTPAGASGGLVVDVISEELRVLLCSVFALCLLFSFSAPLGQGGSSRLRVFWAKVTGSVQSRSEIYGPHDSWLTSQSTRPT